MTGTAPRFSSALHTSIHAYNWDSPGVPVSGYAPVRASTTIPILPARRRSVICPESRVVTLLHQASAHQVGFESVDNALPLSAIADRGHERRLLLGALIEDQRLRPGALRPNLSAGLRAAL